MSKRSKKHRNNTIAGFFILLSIVGFVSIIIILSDFQGLGNHGTYQIWFTTENGTPGLSPGAPVTLAGVKIGTVDEVKLIMDQSDSFGPHVKVTISVDDRFTVNRDAVAGLVVPVLGSSSSINFDNLGSNQPLKENEYLTGKYAATPFLKSAGIGPKEIIALQKTIHNINTISEDTSKITEFARNEVSKSGHEIVNNFRIMVQQVTEVISSFQQDWPAWKKSADDIIQNIQLAADNINKAVQQGKTMLTDAQDTAKQIKQTINDLTPKITKITDNIKNLSDTANQEWKSNISSLLNTSTQGIEHGTSLLSNLDESLALDLPEINRILANMRIASDNLKLTMIEIRAQPWRLLTAPSDEAMQEALLYDLVRTYANSVSDLDASIAELKSLHDHFGDQLDINQDSMKSVLKKLDENYLHFEEAQNSLYEYVSQKTSNLNDKP